MRVAVHNLGVKKPSRAGAGDNQRVTFLNISEEGPKYVYLNMTDYEVDNNTQETIEAKWSKVLHLGWVLDVPVMSGRNYVNKFGQFTIIDKKSVNEDE